METEKNLHASIPNALLKEVQRVADAQQISIDELVRDAMDRRLREIRREKLYTYGESQARKLLIGPDEVEGKVHELREKNLPRGR